MMRALKSRSIVLNLTKQTQLILNSQATDRRSKTTERRCRIRHKHGQVSRRLFINT